MDIEKTKKIHTIGHRLKDAKATVKKDFKCDVGDVKAEGKQGEVVNLPQWVAQVLSDGDIVEMESQDMITELKQALSKEKMVGEYQISTLEPHFYIKLKESIKKLSQYDFDRVESIMMELFRMRRGKLIKIADTIKLNREMYDKLTAEEQIFYKTIYDNSKEFEKQIRATRDE